MYVRFIQKFHRYGCFPHPGPYAGSWTWFDAEIWRPVDSGNDQNGLQLVGSPTTSAAQIKPMMASPTEEMLVAAGYHRVDPPSVADVQSDYAWLVQRNLRAVETPQSYTVAWSDENLVYRNAQPYQTTGLPRLVEGATEVSIADVYGCGNGVGFVRALQPGDRVVVIARAKVSHLFSQAVDTLLSSTYSTRAGAITSTGK